VSEVTAVPELREVHGPSALGGGRQRFFSLLWLMAVTEFKRVYFGTVLGYLWSLVRPLLLFGVLYLVFSEGLKIGKTTEVEHFAVLLLMGIVLFTFFSESTTESVSSVLNQEGVVRKTQFPRLVIPLSTVLTCCFNFALNFFVVLVFVLAFGVAPTWTWLLLPFALLALVTITVAVSAALSVLYVRFRDTQIIWTVVAQVLFYATPVIYPINTFQDQTIERLLMFNPLAVIVEQVRVWVLAEPNAPTAAEAAGGAVWLLPALAIFLGVCAFSVWIFKREAPRIAEDL
jgi:ABC-2 type transport system permease protein